MNHVIWPEGLPDQAHRTTSWAKAQAILFWLQLKWLFPMNKARRMRHATAEDAMPDPHVAEHTLQELGAIPPPGGWPKETSKSGSGPETDVHVRTHAVI